ncbi:uncharacterized protein LOC143421042 [Maylandia zebra]|uniref:uncharacterized protein LOC143421042 n=1 Tax=Maylandia zebra TaxID=106582 RepID=UPI00403CA753
MELIDVDSEVDIKDFDRFHIFLSARGPQMETSLGETSQNQSTTATEEQTQPLKSLLKRKAPPILKEYETTGTLSVPLRKLLVKTCIGDLVERCGYYPLSAEKLTVAKSIINTSNSECPSGRKEGRICPSWPFWKFGHRSLFVSAAVRVACVRKGPFRCCSCGAVRTFS